MTFMDDLRAAAAHEASGYVYADPDEMTRAEAEEACPPSAPPKPPSCDFMAGYAAGRNEAEQDVRREMDALRRRIDELTR